MAVADNLQITITAKDMTGPGIAQAHRSVVDGMKGVGTKESIAETDKATGAWRRFGSVLRDVPKHFREYYHTGGLGRVIDNTRALRQEVEATTSALGRFAPSIAGLGAIGSGIGVIDLFRSVADQATRLQNTAVPFRMSARHLLEWEMAGERQGVPGAAVDASLAGLQQRLMGAAAGNGPDLRFFESWGIAAFNANHQLRGLDAVATDIFRKFKGQSNPAYRQEMLSGAGMAALDPMFERITSIVVLEHNRNGGSRDRPLGENAA